MANVERVERREFLRRIAGFGLGGLLLAGVAALAGRRRPDGARGALCRTAGQCAGCTSLGTCAAPAAEVQRRAGEGRR